MAADAISFFTIGTDGSTTEMRRSGRAWKKARCKIWRIRLLPSRKSSCKWSATKNGMLDGILDTTGELGSIPVVTTDGVLKDERREPMEGRQLECSSSCFLGCNRTGNRRYRGYPSSTTSNHPPAFDATSALRHKGRLKEIRCDNRLPSVFWKSCSRGRHQNLTRKSVEMGSANKWSTILKVTNVCKLTKMLAEELVESASVKCGSDEERARAEGKRGQQHDMQDLAQATIWLTCTPLKQI